MATLIKIDKNGTKYFLETKCPKCGGSGKISYYGHIYNGICFKCNGSGRFETTYKEYTPEYAEKLATKKWLKDVAKSPEINEKFFKTNGFNSDKITYVYLGNTYDIKDELKSEGAIWNSSLNCWVNPNKPTNRKTIALTLDDVAYQNGLYRWYYKDGCFDIVKNLKDKFERNTISDWNHELGDKIDKTLIFKNQYQFETPSFHRWNSMTTMFIYKFIDDDSNIYVWKTTSPMNLKEDCKYNIKGTVKDNADYKGEKQTVLTRCKIEEV